MANNKRGKRAQRKTTILQAQEDRLQDVKKSPHNVWGGGASPFRPVMTKSLKSRPVMKSCSQYSTNHSSSNSRKNRRPSLQVESHVSDICDYDIAYFESDIEDHSVQSEDEVQHDESTKSSRSDSSASSQNSVSFHSVEFPSLADLTVELDGLREPRDSGSESNESSYSNSLDSDGNEEDAGWESLGEEDFETTSGSLLPWEVLSEVSSVVSLSSTMIPVVSFKEALLQDDIRDEEDDESWFQPRQHGEQPGAVAVWKIGAPVRTTMRARALPKIHEDADHADNMELNFDATFFLDGYKQGRGGKRRQMFKGNSKTPKSNRGGRSRSWREPENDLSHRTPPNFSADFYRR